MWLLARMLRLVTVVRLPVAGHRVAVIDEAGAVLPTGSAGTIAVPGGAVALARTVAGEEEAAVGADVGFHHRVARVRGEVGHLGLGPDPGFLVGAAPMA